MVNAMSTHVGEEVKRGDKYSGTVAGNNGYLYGIPYSARRVIKFNPVDKSMTYIGPDFGNRVKWCNGAMTGNGVIYCVPCFLRGILKIDTNTDTVTELDRNLLPEQAVGAWESCAAALDGCVYFMPGDARRVMKLDPNNNDAMTSVGDDLIHENWKGTVVGIDGCVYGIPLYSKRIIKYDPINDVTSFVGELADQDFYCTMNGVLGRDGCIYAHAGGGRVLKIDTTKNSYCFVGNRVQSKDNFNDWGDAILGIDGCIYWPPNHASRTLRYNPHINLTSLVGDELGYCQGFNKWVSGAMATDGVIYYFPTDANRILAIDPIGELLALTKANMQGHPEEFGSLFQKIEANEDSPSHASLTNFDLAVVKFGYSKVFEILEKCFEPVNDFCIESNLCPFMIAASYKESRVCVINHLLCRDLSWVNNCIVSLKGNEE